MEKKIRNIANYIVKMHVGEGYYVNFADCSALPGRRTAREFLFGKATCDEVLSSFAAADFRDEDIKDQLIEEEIREDENEFPSQETLDLCDMYHYLGKEADRVLAYYKDKGCRGVGEIFALPRNRRANDVAEKEPYASDAEEHDPHDTQKNQSVIL